MFGRQCGTVKKFNTLLKMQQQREYFNKFAIKILFYYGIGKDSAII